MNSERAAGGLARGAERTASWVRRAIRAIIALNHERRLSAFAAIGLFVTLFLPWYQETVIVSGSANKLAQQSATLTGWGAFSFVEAAVLVVAFGVLTLLFQRAEGHAFHVPGGDGGVIAAAGLWTCVLVIWRIFDKQGTTNHGQLATSSGIEWGIFIALAVAGFMAWTGFRIRAAHEPEPPLPGEPPGRSSAATPGPSPEPMPGPEAMAEPRSPSSEQLTIPLHGDEPGV
jgi:hypothetical protein